LTANTFNLKSNYSNFYSEHVLFNSLLFTLMCIGNTTDKYSDKEADVTCWVLYLEALESQTGCQKDYS